MVVDTMILMKVSNKKKMLVGILLFLILMLGYLVFTFFPVQKGIEKTPVPLMTYTDFTYGFSIAYPKSIIPEKTFQKYYLLSDQWMAGVNEGSKGLSLLALPVFRVTNENSYPRYWNVEVRIGITTDPDELQTLLSESVVGEEPPKSILINGCEFFRFPIKEAGMMQLMEGYSYRTIHGGIGYVIEQIKTGSTYREEESSKDIPDTVLDDYFQQTENIIHSFRFIPTDS